MFKVLDWRGINSIFFLFLHENICCGYSLEVPQRGSSNLSQKHMFLRRNNKNVRIFWLKPKTPDIFFISPQNQLFYEKKKKKKKNKYEKSLFVVCKFH